MRLQCYNCVVELFLLFSQFFEGFVCTRQSSQNSESRSYQRTHKRFCPALGRCKSIKILPEKKFIFMSVASKYLKRYYSSVTKGAGSEIGLPGLGFTFLLH